MCFKRTSWLWTSQLKIKQKGEPIIYPDIHKNSVTWDLTSQLTSTPNKLICQMGPLKFFPTSHYSKLAKLGLKWVKLCRNRTWLGNNHIRQKWCSILVLYPSHGGDKESSADKICDFVRHWFLLQLMIMMLPWKIREAQKNSPPPSYKVQLLPYEFQTHTKKESSKRMYECLKLQRFCDLNQSAAPHA